MGVLEKLGGKTNSFSLMFTADIESVHVNFVLFRYRTRALVLVF